MHPLVWTAARRLRAESERACDDLVLASGTPASEYADHLLQILVGVRGNDAPAVALPMGRRREFEGRMLAILDPALRRSGSLLVHGGVLVALSLGALTLMAMAPAQVSSEPPLASRSSGGSLQADEEAALVSITTDGLRLELRAGGVADGQGEIIAGRDALDASEPPALPAYPEPPHHTNADPHPQSDPHPVATLTTAAERVLEGAVNNFVSGTMSMLFGFGSEGEKNIPLLIRLLETDDSGEVRRTAAWALAGEPGEEVAAALLRALREDDDAEVREMAAWGLREVTSTAAIEALVRSVVDDSSPDVRARAAWALGREGLRSNGVLEALSTALADGNAEVRELAAWAIGTIHPTQAPAALSQRGLRDSEPEVRTAAAWAIGQIRDPAAKPALAAAFESEADKEPLEALTWALLKLGPLDSSAVETLLGSSDPEIRARAIRIAAGVGVEFWPWPWPWPEPRPMP
jgi:HEAT repeat protein